MMRDDPALGDPATHIGVVTGCKLPSEVAQRQEVEKQKQSCASYRQNDADGI
jgi:hypothetical protein